MHAQECMCVSPQPWVSVLSLCVCVCVHSCTSIGKLICLVGVSVCLGSSGCESTSHPCHEDAAPCKWKRVFTAAGVRGRLGGGERAAQGLGPARGKLQGQRHSEAPGGSCRSRPFLPAPPFPLPLIPGGVRVGAGGARVWGRCGRVWEVRWAFSHVSGPSVLLGGYSRGAGCARESVLLGVRVRLCVCVCAAPTMCSIDMCVREGGGERGLTPSSCFHRVVPETSWGIDPDTPYSEGRPGIDSTHCPV